MGPANDPVRNPTPPAQPMHGPLGLGPAAFRWELSVLTVRLTRLLNWHITRGGQPYWRLYWNRDPGAVVELDDHRISLDPGRVVLISPNTPFEGSHTGQPLHLFVHFLAGDPMDRLARMILPIEPLGPWLEVLERLVGQTQEEPRPLDRSTRLAVAGLTSWALSHVPADRWPRVIGDSRIETTTRAIQADLARRWRNEDLARLAHLATNAFIRRFAQVMGQPPGEFLMRRRIDRACVLLEHTDQSIETIAESCGFCDRSYFSTVFKNRTGLSPARYRRELA